MIAAKSGYIAEFITGYLQREVRMELKVADGIDSGLRDPFVRGIAVGRLAKVDGGYLKPAANLTEAEYIVAQSDDTVRNEPRDYNYPERYSTLPNLIVKNSEEVKTVALYKLVNKDDVKLVKISEPVEIESSDAQFLLTGINQFKVVGVAPYVAVPTVSGNVAGNYLRFKFVNADITTAAAFNAALTGVLDSAIVYKRVNAIDENTETKTTIAGEIGENGGIEVEVNVTGSKELIFEIMWEAGKFTKYVFDLSELAMAPQA